MKSLKTLVAPFLLLLILNGAVAQNAGNAITAKEIIDKAIIALGGREYLLSINTLYTDITTEMDGRKVHWITKEMQPNKGAFQIVYDNRIVFQNWYDGTTGYEMSNGKKVQADANQFKDKPFKKNIFNELDYLDSSLWKLELAGSEKVNKEDCYKIKAILANGLVKLLYFSKTTFFMLREDKVANTEKDSFSTTLFSEYKKFGQLTFYTIMKFGTEKNAQTGKIVNLLVNEQITESDFK